MVADKRVRTARNRMPAQGAALNSDRTGRAENSRGLDHALAKRTGTRSAWIQELKEHTARILPRCGPGI